MAGPSSGGTLKQNSTSKKKRDSLKAYVMTRQITKAPEKAGIDRGTHCDWLKDPEYQPILR